MKRIARIIAMMLFFTFILLLSPHFTSAIEKQDLDTPVTLSFTYIYDGKPIPNVQCFLYKVGDSDGYAGFTATAGFEDLNVEINGLETASQWDELAEKISLFIDENKVAPVAAAQSDGEGKVSFGTGEETLFAGLYLVRADKMRVVIKQRGSKQSWKDYWMVPCLVSLPNHPAEDSETWQYDVVLYPKLGSDTGGDILPPTGLLWWPVPVLFSVGLVFLCCGLRKRKNSMLK